MFLEGWFKDTLHVAPIEKLAVLRVDGDMYESTIQAMDALYEKLSPGGFLIVDDYFLPPCAIHELGVSPTAAMSGAALSRPIFFGLSPVVGDGRIRSAAKP